jgi:copper(I)-binding protein
MMLGLSKKLRPGEQTACTLTFQNAGSLRIHIPVLRAGATQGGIQGVHGNMPGMQHAQ